MQLAITYNYKSRCLLIKEVLRYIRCQMALDKIFSKRRDRRKCATVVNSQDITLLLCALLLRTEVLTCSVSYQKLEIRNYVNELNW